MIVLDSRPFEDLHQTVQDFGDDRIWVFAEWVRGVPRVRGATVCMAEL